MAIYLSICRILRCKPEKQLQLLVINPGWQFNTYLCTYVAARFISLLTFFHCKSLPSINCVATIILQCGEISVFGRIRCIAPKYEKILRGSSNVPHWWFIDPTHVGPTNQRYFFLHQIFNHLLKLNPTDFLYVDIGRDDYYSC